MKYFSMIMFVILAVVCTTAYSEPASESNNFERHQIYIIPEPQPSFVYCQGALKNSIEEINSLVIACASDNVISKEEMTQIHLKAYRLKKFKKQAEENLGSDFWKMDPKILQDTYFSIELTGKYFKPIFWKRDIDNLSRANISRITGSFPKIETYFSWTSFMLSLISFLSIGISHWKSSWYCKLLEFGSLICVLLLGFILFAGLLGIY